MGKRLKRGPAVEDVDAEGTVSSVSKKTKTRNTGDDSKVNSRESKVKKVRKKRVTRCRKRPCEDGSGVVDAPVNIGCDNKRTSIEVPVCVDGDTEMKTVANTPEFRPSKDPDNPDCISPAAKLAKQLKCFKDRHSAGLTQNNDPMSLSEIFGGRQSPNEFDCATGKRTRKRKGNTISRKGPKQVNANADRASLGKPTFSVPSGSEECKHLVDNTNKRSRKPRGNRKVKTKQTVDGSREQHNDIIGCVDPQNVIASDGGEHKIARRKRTSKDKTENSAGKKAVTKTAKISVVDSGVKKRKQPVPRNRRNQAKGKGRRSVGEMETEVAVTGGGDCIVPQGGAVPSGEGEVAGSSSDSESDWEEVDELPGANLSVRDQLPRGPVEIILEAPTLRRGKKHKEIDIKTYYRRLMNRYKKETQLDMHKVHLLCLLCYGFHRNEICKDATLQAVALSLVPARFVEVTDWDVNLLGKLAGWFKGHFSVDPHLPGNTDDLVAALVSGVSQACVSSQTELVFVFVALLRSLGLDVRLVISLQPVPIKATDLDMKTSARNGKKATTSGEVRMKSVKKLSKRESKVKKGSRRVTLKDDPRKNDGSVPKLDVDESKEGDVTLAAKISAKCRMKTKTKTCEEEEVGSKRYVKAEAAGGCPATRTERGRSRRRVSRVNYAEGGKQEDGDEDTEAGRSSEDEDSGDEEVKADGGKGKGKGKDTMGREAEEEQGYLQEISDDDFIEETIILRIAAKAQKPMRQKRRHKESDSEDCVLMDSDSSGTDHWAEVFLPCEQSWICVDCVCARVGEPEKMERRTTSPISYVVAYDNKRCVKDVTSRYASHWMHSTRRLRVSPEWWQVVLASHTDTDEEREKRENDELKAKFTEEPLPSTIGQYKNHPLYALKRHLLKFEAIYPPTALVLGYVRGEPVYPRECVHNLHSRETWLKEGLVVKVGEEPYKMVRARPKWHKPHENTTDPTLPIFGRWQTEIYVAPPAVDGKVPVNEYGNVELFQPSMLPAGTVHIRVPGLQKVAKKLNLDCRPAMMGWDFHGGYNHPVMDGWVVCKEHKEILLAAWDEDQEIQRQRDLEKREIRAVDNWKLLVKGLLIKQRLKRRYDLQETASGSGGKTEDTVDPRPATDTALAWPQNRRQAQPREKAQDQGALFPFEMERM